MKFFQSQIFIIFQKLIPQHLLSRFTGWLANCQAPWLKNFLIQKFVSHYQVNMDEAAEPKLELYPNFNAFFTRELKANVRPIDSSPQGIISPADGVISQAGKIYSNWICQAKGRGYDLLTLLGGNEVDAEPFIDGYFSTIYLSPKDYHRIHMPVEATLSHSIYVPGKLFSVNQTTTENIDQLFARNERLIAFFDTPYGPMVMVLVGAMIVAGIETVWSGQEAPFVKSVIRKAYGQHPSPITLKKGEEMGRFKLGSTVILLFGKDKIQWQPDIRSGYELKMGELIAQEIQES